MFTPAPSAVDNTDGADTSDQSTQDNTPEVQVSIIVVVVVAIILKLLILLALIFFIRNKRRERAARGCKCYDKSNYRFLPWYFLSDRHCTCPPQSGHLRYTMVNTEYAAGPPPYVADEKEDHSNGHLLKPIDLEGGAQCIPTITRPISMLQAGHPKNDRQLSGERTILLHDG